ncbi:Histidine kinase [Abeliophyllum distichum]|uniref:Histidine kinase n=1 Tax=Abeliophyllum distichum TaxID=126358 RepID=A0ABD1VQJ5_9LAMI
MVRTENEIQVKLEAFEPSRNPKPQPDDSQPPACIINLSSSDSGSDSDSDSLSDNDITGIVNKRPRVSSGEVSGNKKKKKKKTVEDLSFVLPVGFLDPLPGKEQVSRESEPALALPAPPRRNAVVVSGCKQFWKAGDYDGAPSGDWESTTGGMDHVRVHPKFLHSNATSHKWVLGAFAELLDNSLDEVCNGATYVNIDMVKSKKDGSKMLLIEDNGGGMDPDKMRQCMSLGYSVKSKMVDTIGQYGNGFKTSTMRLGADVIVFSRCGKGGKRPTQSIGLLSYTFLKSTGKEDIVVPLLDYERREQEWQKIIRSSLGDWNINVETIVQWSPFSSEADLLRQFNQMKNHGTRIIVYNLWEDDQGLLELDFDTDPHDIQIRGVNRDEKNILMAQSYPNSRHFLTYRHSLRSYASILYLRIPPGFRIILRGKDVEHHNIVNDMMMSQEVTYRPQPGTDGVPKDANMVAAVTIGFVKDAKSHIDVQGFNVYHKNRLIKPFWRLWHAPGSDGRGVIGVLEANFVEPAHDKQGFERTTVLARLEARLIQMQKTYWSSNCHLIGYAPRRNKKAQERDSSPDSYSPTRQSKKNVTSSSSKTPIKSVDKGHNKGHVYGKDDMKKKASGKRRSSSGQSSSSAEDVSDDDVQINISRNRVNGLSSRKLSGKDGSPMPSGLKYSEASGNLPVVRPTKTTRNLRPQENDYNREEFSRPKSSSDSMERLKEENQELRERLQRKEEEILGDLLHDLQNEKDRCKSLEAELHEASRKIEELSKEQESLIDIFSEERERRDIEEENLRKKLKDASNTIQELLDKVRLLEKRSLNGKLER